jgi:acetolactate synthase-1/3 small subunit
MNMYVMMLITQNTLCMLQKVAGVYSRYRVNIEHLNASRHSESLSYWNVVVNTTDDKMELLVHQLRKVVGLVEVKVIDKMPLSEVDKPVINDKF